MSALPGTMLPLPTARDALMAEILAEVMALHETYVKIDSGMPAQLEKWKEIHRQMDRSTAAYEKRFGDIAGEQIDELLGKADQRLAILIERALVPTIAAQHRVLRSHRLLFVLTLSCGAILALAAVTGVALFDRARTSIEPTLRRGAAATAIWDKLEPKSRALITAAEGTN